MTWEPFGYDRYGRIRQLDTTLQKDALNAFDISLAAMAFNAPAWVTAASMPILYALVGNAAPLAILIAFVFPMLVLALCLVCLTREAPSAGGIFTFSSRFLHPVAGTLLGWTYIIACAAVVPMTAVVGTHYLQALFSPLKGPVATGTAGTILILSFMLICLRGVTLTARVAMLLLCIELTVIVGLALCGIVSPHVHVPAARMLTPSDSWYVLGSGVLSGVWMLANFDSAINYIEEARIPVRTVQRSLLAVLFSAFVVYMIVAVGWQRAVPVSALAVTVENGDGGPIGAVANQYLPPWLSSIAILVVITSAIASMQIAMSAGARTAYRMAQEGHLPGFFGRTNRHFAPWISVLTIALLSIVFVWLKPLTEFDFYYNTLAVTLAVAYMAALAAFVRLMFTRHSVVRATLSSFLPVMAFAVLGYLLYSAGVAPAEAKDIYQAWYIGVGVLGSGLALVLLKKLRRNAEPMSIAAR
ncbi:MAG: APC family permease [Steroidobacteraceae bacterium]|jgi:amino acid transporter